MPYNFPINCFGLHEELHHALIIVGSGNIEPSEKSEIPVLHHRFHFGVNGFAFVFPFSLYEMDQIVEMLAFSLENLGGVHGHQTVKKHEKRLFVIAP